MKKILYIILIIYTVIVTIGCAIFGILFFKEKNNTDDLSENRPSTQSITYYEAKTLVDKVYEMQVGTPVASLASLDYKDYTEKEINEKNIDFSSTRYKKVLKDFKNIFDNNWVTDVWFNREGSIASAKAIDNNDWLNVYDSVLEATEYFRVFISGQSVTLKIVQSTSSTWFKDSTDTKQPGENSMSFVFKITKVGEHDWTTDYYEKCYFINSASNTIKDKKDYQDYRVSVYHLQYETNSTIIKEEEKEEEKEKEEENKDKEVKWETKIVKAKIERVVTSLKTFEKEIQNNQISEYAIFDCDLNTHKSLYAKGPINIDLGITNLEKLEWDDVYLYGKKLYNDAIKIMGTYMENTEFKNCIVVNV